MPGPLADAGRAVARSAQLRAAQSGGRPMRVLPPTQSAASLVLRAGTRRRSAQGIVMQMSGLVRAISDMHQAAGELDRSRELEIAAVTRLDELSNTPSSSSRSAVIVALQPPSCHGNSGSPRHHPGRTRHDAVHWLDPQIPTIP
jgi:hypothetical protein